MNNAFPTIFRRMAAFQRGISAVIAQRFPLHTIAPSTRSGKQKTLIITMARILKAFFVDVEDRMIQAKKGRP